MSEELVDLLERLASDDEFRVRVHDNKEALAEIGWKPEAIAAIEVTKKKGYWGCGSVCGCTARVGQGCGTKVGHIASGDQVIKIKGC